MNAKLGGKIWSGVAKVFRSRLLTSLPLFIYLFLSSIYFLSFLRLADGPGAHPIFWVSTDIENEAAKYAAELLKQKFQLAGYGLTLIIILFCVRDFIRFWAIEKTLLGVFSILILTTFVSDNPERVVTNLLHLTFGVIAAWLYFSHEHRRKKPVYSAAIILFYSLIFVQVVSVVWYFAHPNGSIDSILLGKRQGGLAGNPNTFGAICIASSWAVFTLIFSQERHRVTSVLWGIPIAVVAFNAWSTGSATTMTTILVVFLLFTMSSGFGKLGRKNKALIIVVSTIAFFGILFWFVIQQNILKIAETATSSVGKDLTFTGRLDLWLLAVEAIAERPILGWSYDNHATILDNPLYAQRYNHFHNGFLDTLIVGGILFGFAVLTNFYMFASRVRRLSAKGVYVSPLVIGVIAACMHNLTEYSMFRNNTLIWMVYIVCFVSVAVQFTGGTRPTTPNKLSRVNTLDSPRRSSRRSRSRTKRYSW